MQLDSVNAQGPTRREYVTYGGSAVVGSVLAGCTGSGTSGPSLADGGAGGDSSYTVTMEPIGEVKFDSVPETWIPYTGDYDDMGVALGTSIVNGAS
ncbi:hypothetical protein [Natrinema halophilum]|uniref:Uncharacterized protein n=1 Tax=Natrinema halophilum TaxID=1699371 RepID=A0A7D5K7K8_9EURY|nr:hypothetical protein [Natrinema halophilum]QLG50083.1 hypothetical protein HYG82_15070 [Natrinema halophilum]